MEKEQVERLLKLFLKMLMEHPELCPHEWEFCYSYPNIKNGKYGRTYEYRCGICGEHKFEFKEEEK